MQFSPAGRPKRPIRSTHLHGWLSFYFFFFFLYCCCCCCSSSSPASISDKFALLDFKTAVSDPSGVLFTWVSTNSSDHLEHCSWYGVVCSGPDSRVSALSIAGGGARRAASGVKFHGEKLPCFDVFEFPFYGFGIRRPCLAGNGNFFGKLPSVIAKLTEIRVLSLPFHGFSGQIPAEVWGLENLEVLDLEGNSFTGSLPPSFPALPKLRVLNLGFNEIDGEIPVSLSKYVELEVLNLAANRLRGSIPSFIGSYSKLSGLYLSYNSFEGEIPTELAHNCHRNLKFLDLSGNTLVGGIPDTLGNCFQLRALMLSSNQLSDAIPSSIGKLKKLEVLDVSRNSLSGLVPKELGNCADLSVLVLSNVYGSSKAGTLSSERNSFGGSIPTEIASLAKLRVLWAPGASLKGEIPRNWGHCDSLEAINLSHNFFTGGIKGAFEGCKNLIYVDLSSNKLTGQLDEEFPVSCTVVFDVSGNLLSGAITIDAKGACRPLPSWVSDNSLLYGPAVSYLSFFAHKARFEVSSSNSRLLVVHNFGHNNFSGYIHSLPLTTSRIRRKPDYVFLADGNKLAGSFPWHLFNVCHKINGLFLKMNDNKFSGQIPMAISGMCKSLKYLDASGNQMSGIIPRHVEGVASIVLLDMNPNKLENAQFPLDLGRLNHLHFFSMSSERFSGALPLSWRKLLQVDPMSYSSSPLAVKLLPDDAKLRNLAALVFHKNHFPGELQSSLSSYATHADHRRRVLFTDLSNCTNTLMNASLMSCQMPEQSSYSSFQSSSAVTQDTLSPASENEPEYSGGNKFNSIEIASLVSASTIVAVLLALVGVCIYTRKYGQKGGSRVQVLEREITVFNDIGVPLTFQSIVKATEAFSARNCIGHGGFGATYRAELSPGVIVAVKRLAVGRVHCVQQFHAEIKTLGRIKNQNLVTLIGYHASETEMFLIYNYLPGGNLENFIQDRRNKPVSWKVLHKIALDVANALAYLHDSCDPRVIHRDVKPSNILLDNEFNAFLSDFGLSRLLGNSETHATTGVEGTFGYLAPEYAMTCRVSEKADVYSYGVVLLELISDKRALDPSFSAHGDGFNIVSWACMLLKQGKAKEVFTAGLWDSGPKDDLVEVLHLAVKCTLDSLTVRPTMKQVVHLLKRLRSLS